MFKEIFVELLQKRGVTAYKLSRDTGLADSLVSNWKSGRQLPKYDSLIILADYFDVSADYLLGRTDNPKTSTSADNNSGTIGVVGNSSAPVTVNGGVGINLSPQEQDLLNIFKAADGKTQTRIMNFVYNLEERNKNISQ